MMMSSSMKPAGVAVPGCRSGPFRIASLALVLVAGLEGLEAPCQAAEEPVYLGRPLSFWVLEDRKAYKSLSSYREVDLDPVGKAAVRAAGTDAIPYLVNWLKGSNGWYAAKAFGVLGPLAQSVVPDLERMATNSLAENPQAAVFALGQIGPTSLPALCSILTNRGLGHLVRITAAGQLLDMGTNAQAAVPALTECLKEHDSGLVSDALAALRNMRVTEASVHEAEKGVLLNTNAMLRGAALWSLAVFGRQAVPDLVRSLEDGPVSGVALEVLIGIAPEALTNAAVIQAAAEGLGSSDRDRRQGAARVLRAAGQQARGLKPDTLPVPGGWERVLNDARNALRQLAPEFVHEGE